MDTRTELTTADRTAVEDIKRNLFCLHRNWGFNYDMTDILQEADNPQAVAKQVIRDIAPKRADLWINFDEYTSGLLADAKTVYHRKAGHKFDVENITRLFTVAWYATHGDERIKAYLKKTVE